jgi:hypothetical protein
MYLRQVFEACRVESAPLQSQLGQETFSFFNESSATRINPA